MTQLRSAPTWLIGMLAGIAYAVLWWGAIGLSYPLARQLTGPSEPGGNDDGILGVLIQLTLWLGLLLGFHVIWSIGFRRIAHRAKPWFFTLATVLLFPAVIAAALLVGWGLGSIGFVGATIAVPIIASALILAGPKELPASRR